MAYININAGLKTPNWVYSHGASFNGCSGTSLQISRNNMDEYSFSRAEIANFWNLVRKCAYPQDNRRLSVIYVENGIKLPSPKRWFCPPEHLAAYYLKSGRQVLAVLSCNRPAHFNEPASPPALFLSDPEKYVSLAHLERVGMFHRAAVVTDRGLPRQQKDWDVVSSWSNQLTLRGSLPNPHIADLAQDWSREISWFPQLPWWEKYRLAGFQYPNAKECVSLLVDWFAKCSHGFSEFGGLAHVSGNAAVRGPLDSFRAVFCFHSLNPEATMDLAATPAIINTAGTMPVYYKVLPFYYHSPQHDNHRVATCFLSDKPIHLERIS